MPMMGSPGGSSEISLTEAIGLLKDEPAYQTRMQHLVKHLEDSKVTLAQAAENNRKAEETKKLAAGMITQAEGQLVEARRLKEEADKKVAAAAAHEKDLNARQEAWQKEAAGQKEHMARQLNEAFASREKEVAAKEQKLLAKTKEFEAIQADRDARANEFDAYRKAKEAELARVHAEIRENEGHIKRSAEQNETTRLELKAKLDAIKAISAG